MSKFRVTVHSLNLREQASISSRRIGFLHRDEIVSLIEVCDDSYWFHVETITGKKGWASSKYLEESIVLEPIGHDDDPPWLNTALSEVGIKEHFGNSHNPRIVEYHRSTYLHSNLANKDETHWCSSFVNWCIEKNHYEGTDSPRARDWENWGAELTSPRRGCIVVLKRGNNPSTGHVGFYMGETEKEIKVLGGNQDDEVKIKQYPKEKLIGYRWPGLFEVT